MLTTLQPYLSFHPDETLTSYVSRLSLFHTGQGPQRLLADFGLSYSDVQRGSPVALNKLADISGVNLAALQGGTIGRIKRCRTFRGERWTREFVKPEWQRICPHCLLEDTVSFGVANQRRRIAWQLRPVTTCEIHQCAMIEVGSMSGDEELGALFYRRDHLEFLIQATIQQDPSALETWIYSKLSGKEETGCEWLNGQTLEQGVRVCEMLGSVLNGGIHVDLKRMTLSELRCNGVTGYEIAKLGPDAVTTALDQIRGSSKSQAGQAGPKAMYGRLFEWLAYRTQVVDPGPINDLLREHILNHTAIDVGEFLLGSEVTTRRCHSVYSLSIATNMHAKRLRKVLETKGLVPADCSGVALNLLVFPAEETERFCLELLDTIPLNKLPFEIGGTRTQVTTLHREGIINAIIDRAPEIGIGRIDFARAEIDGFLLKIAQLPEVEPAADRIDLTSASKRTVISTGQILKHIFAGTLIASRNKDRTGLDALRFSIADLCEFRARVIS